MTKHNNKQVQKLTAWHIIIRVK